MVILSSIELSFYPKEGGNMAFSIDPASTGNITAKLTYNSREPSRLGSRLKEVRLTSSGILSAVDELRGILRPLGDVTYPYYCYNLGTRKDGLALWICDHDPTNHRTLAIGGQSFTLNEDRSRSAAFLEALAKSPFCERRPYWKSRNIIVRLKLRHAHRAHRLDTYAKLLELY